MEHPAFVRRMILWVALTVVVTGLLVACGGGQPGGDVLPTATPPPAETAPPEPEEEGTPITEEPDTPTEEPTEGSTEAPTATVFPDVPSILVQNESGTDICSVFISPVDSDDWGDNWIDEPPIEADDWAFFELESGLWDVKVEDCDGHIMHALRNANIQFRYDMVVAEGGAPTAPVTIANAGQMPICHVFISPPIAQDWGDDWMAKDETIEVGDSRTFDVPASYYDFRVAACDNTDMAVTYEVQVEGPTTLEMP